MGTRAEVVGARIFRAGAISNYLVTVPAFIVYNRYVNAFLPDPPRYPFLVWIWSGMAFLWGVMFWEISRDPVGKYPLIKYAYLEKAITSTSAVVAYAVGDVPGKFLAGIVVTDIVWIPLFVLVQRNIARLRRTAA